MTLKHLRVLMKNRGWEKGRTWMGNPLVGLVGLFFAFNDLVHPLHALPLSYTKIYHGTYPLVCHYRQRDLPAGLAS